MPGKLIPGEKKTPIYKKSSGFKMKSPLSFWRKDKTKIVDKSKTGNVRGGNTFSLFSFGGQKGGN